MADLEFEEDHIVITEGTEHVEVPYVKGGNELTILAERDGAAVTIKEVRQAVTEQALTWLRQHPGEELDAETFREMIRSALGPDPRAKVFNVGQWTRVWWQKLVMPSGEPVFQRTGERDKPSFTLHPSVVSPADPTQASAPAREVVSSV